jgi:hypothetical protein
MENGSQDELAGRGRTTSSHAPDVPNSGSESLDGQSFTSVYPLSWWPVRRFVPGLRQISSQLPESIRARVILELVADLEALLRYHRARGLTEDEAARRVEETLLVSPDAVQHLIAVHTTPYQRWVSRAAGRLRWGFDLVLFIVGILPILIASVLVIGTQAPPLGFAPLLWPILACAVGITVIAVKIAHQLFVNRERASSRLHRGLRSLIFLGAAGPVLGVLAVLIGLQRLATLLSGPRLDGAAQVAIVEQTGRDTTLLALGLLLAFGAGLVWFVLVNRIATIERMETAALLALE